MYCRLLDDLDSQARNAQDRVSWARAVCKIAVHRARQGQVDEAHALILRVRETFGVELHHEIAPWVMLAEGVIHYFRLDMIMSWERLRRAYALAVGLKMESARSACAAWMAMSTFNISRFDDMTNFLREVLDGADVNDHHARGRAGLVLADAYHSADRYDLARRWYDYTRNQAAAEGDQALISAMLFNVATIRTANVRIASAFGISREQETLRARMEVDSSRTYDAAVGANSCEGATPLMRGQLMVVEGKYSDALNIFSGIDESLLRRSEVPLLLADRALCYASTAQESLAQQLLSRCREQIVNLTHPDDLAFTFGRLAQTAQILGLCAESAKYKALAAEKLTDHLKYQADMLNNLSILTSTLSIPVKQKGPASAGP